jgi:hypothetical protein
MAERFGFLKPSVDAHVLGLTTIADLINDAGGSVALAPADVCRACDRPEGERESGSIERWIRDERIQRLGFSYRLSPEDGVALYARLARILERRFLFADMGGPVRALYFAGLPEACRLAREQVPRTAATFDGEETPVESLARLGFRSPAIPAESARALAYDEDRLAFGRELVRKGDYLGLPALDRAGTPGYGSAAETVDARLGNALARHALPLYRAHMGQYLPGREEAVRAFLEQARDLARRSCLDVLSIGTSQLSQSDFGADWSGRTNGGGVPLNSREEMAAAWRAARPMLVRSYAGTRDVPAMARLNEETIHNAWHALSLWWFCRIDNRGPHALGENLRQHVEAMRYIASVGTPLEPNVPHHFAFRGADDVTWVAAGWIAARAAKAAGIRRLISQHMLTTPKYTWGVQDLARSRALLVLLRGLEDDTFSVTLETRAGLDYLSADPERARSQLAAVSVLMDDIEPGNDASPGIVHVVSWTEETRFADPEAIEESVRISRQAILEHRRLRARGTVEDMGASVDVAERTDRLVSAARTVIRGIESTMDDPWGAEGLYRLFAAGFLPVPWLWECRDEFPEAVAWRTKLRRGATVLVDERGFPLDTSRRVAIAVHNARRQARVHGA